MAMASVTSWKAPATDLSAIAMMFEEVIWMPL
jgi:hypothetical protein